MGVNTVSIGKQALGWRGKKKDLSQIRPPTDGVLMRPAPLKKNRNKKTEHNN